MSDLGLAPSEVRDMTLGELWAVTHRATRSQRADENNLDELYTELMELKAREAEAE